MISRRAAKWAAVLLALCCVPSAALYAFLHKAIDTKWERCGVGDREVRSLASDGARLFAAVNQPGHGDVMSSTDQCENFNPAMLTTEVVWSVAWFPERSLLCAGARDQLYCGEPTHLRATTVKQDVYYVVEHDGTLVAGGYPSVFAGPAGTLGFKNVGTFFYASNAAAVSANGVLVTGDELRRFDDATQTFSQLRYGLPRAGALTARARRVYVAGSDFEFSDDGGETFTLATLPGTQPETLLMPVDDPDVVLLGTHGDVRAGDAYLSRDRGRTWTALGCPGSEIHALAVDSKYLYCGATALFGTRGLWRIPREAVGL